MKRIGYGEIDASLVGAAIPYGLVDPQSEIMSQTLCRIEEHLTSPLVEYTATGQTPITAAANGFC